jgi:mannose-1-phosphate guanylyltransferase
MGSDKIIPVILSGGTGAPVAAIAAQHPRQFLALAA